MIQEYSKCEKKRNLDEEINDELISASDRAARGS